MRFGTMHVRRCRETVKFRITGASAVSKSDNPFNPGGGAMPPYLAGRHSEIAAFERMVQRIQSGQAENLLVQGLRGMGKTVLMHKFHRMCVGNGLVPISRGQFSRKHSDPEELARALKHGVRTGIETFSRLENAKRKFTAAVKYVRPEVERRHRLTYREEPYDPGGRTPYENHLENYLVENWEIIEKSEYRGAVLLFDEFHSVRDEPKRSWYTLSDFVGVLAEVQRRGCGYFSVFSGLPTLRPRINEARSYSERMFGLLNIASLGLDDAKKALSEPLLGSKYTFSPDLMDQVAADTGGCPYFLQFFGREILNNAGKTRIALGDYRRIRKMITALLDCDFYDERMDALSLVQKQVLAAMSKAEGDDMQLSEIEEASGMGKAGLARHLVQLEEKGMVHRRGREAYRFSLPMLREYLRRGGACAAL